MSNAAARPLREAESLFLSYVKINGSGTPTRAETFVGLSSGLSTGTIDKFTRAAESLLEQGLVRLATRQDDGDDCLATTYFTPTVEGRAVLGKRDEYVVAFCLDDVFHRLGRAYNAITGFFGR